MFDNMATTTVQTRLPTFLWESLQTTFFEHDQRFIHDIATILNIPPTELKRKILGARAPLTNTVVVASDTAWWERELCPLYVRRVEGEGANDAKIVWHPCGHPCEAHGACARHRFWEMMRDPNVKHRKDVLKTRGITKRLPKRWKDEIVWVGPAGDAIHEDGTPVEGLRICQKSGILLEEP